MSHKFLPMIVVSASDRRRLGRLVSSAMSDGHSVASFLAQELARAEVVPDGSDELQSVVTMGSCVSYSLNWGSPVEPRKLIYPDEYAPDQFHVSILFPLGAALIGVKVGSRMPYSNAGWMHVVRVESVKRPAPNVIRLLPPPGRSFAGREPSDGSGSSSRNRDNLQ